MWQRVQNWLREPPAITRPLPPAGPAVPAERTPVVIVDAVRDGAGEALLKVLTEQGGLPARLTRVFEVAPRIMLALPAAPERRAEPADEVFVVLNRLAGSHVTTPVPACRMVVVWCVPSVARAILAVPEQHGTAEHPPARWNAAGSLLGTAWRRELDVHAGNEFDAVRCRSAQIIELIEADNNSTLSGGRSADFRAELERFDPHVVHAMCVQVRDTGARWVALESVLAAARVRFGVAPSPPPPKGSGFPHWADNW